MVGARPLGAHRRFGEGIVMPAGRRPTKEELQRAAGKMVPDILGPDLRVLFVGINPGLYSGAVGHHFARPGNRFWPALYGSGFVDRPLSPFDEQDLSRHGVGITNFVARATARADELSDEELRAGVEALAAKVRKCRVSAVAFLGLTAYRVAFGEKAARTGRQERRFEGARVWVLPNPSGLNAHYQLADFVRMFKEIRDDAEQTGGPA
jgi:TDG/mug DNA glycosylase family protein